MNEPVIDIRDRIEKMRNQITPQSRKIKKSLFKNLQRRLKLRLIKLILKKKFVELQSKINKNENKRSISDAITEKKRI